MPLPLLLLAAIVAFLVAGAVAYKLKPGASVAGLHPVMESKLDTIAAIMRRHGAPGMVTAGTDGTHGANSLHYVGRATDWRTWGVTDVHACRNELARTLGPEFDVVIEATHIHVEWDPDWLKYPAIIGVRG